MPSHLETESRDETMGALLRPVLLAFCDGASLQLELPSEGSITIGRGDGCVVRIDHPSVSRRHARLHAGKSFTIEDAGSRNGTRVRGIRIGTGSPIIVRSGDVIECGDATLLLRELPASGTDALRVGAREFLVGVEARWFQPPTGGRVNLGRRGAVRRVLLRLVEHRVAKPGEGLSVDEIVQAGWPKERMQYESGVARAYVTVQRLRALGLKDVLLTRDDGYLLDPGVLVERRNQD
jgi:hypothetical protein